MAENKNRHSVSGNYIGRDKNRAEDTEENMQSQQKSVTVNKPTSLATLIVWNISKALENNPDINLPSALNAVQAKLGQESRDVSTIMPRCPEERYLSCAILAWQQLGHENADSLYHFYEKNIPPPNLDNKATTNRTEINCSANDLKQKLGKDGFYSKKYASSYDSFSSGPVVKLPVQTKIVMRLENASSGRQKGKKQKIPEKEIKDKIKAACCMDTECSERLTAVDATTNELRTRASKLARREAERMELLERAEAAWKDLELGYHRRLVLAEEKEENLSKQMKKVIDERNGYKTACMNLAQNLKERGQLAEEEREALTKLEKEVCCRACVRLRLSEECARAEAVLNENQIRVSQLDRDLQFKEEQARHKLFSIEGEVSSARALTHETERAMRAELGALREQVAQVSVQLLEEEAENDRIKQEIDALQKEKMEMIEDLDGCKIMCDNRMQGEVDELRKKRAQLNELKDKVMECRCKAPIDVNVEVKRTPSLAALCRCTAEEKILESCSCTSLRGILLSNLLADLFGGLQAELGGSVSQMPCQLLKCLEDKHNWDRTSIVKKNLQQFFSQLLVAELDIAIATSIEKYHAKWVGSTCADRAKLTAEPEKIDDEGWQERLLEQRAQKLASQLAEQLFQERAEQLTRRAKDIVMSGPPPCACKSQTIFPCLVKSTRMPTIANEIGSPNNTETPDHWRRALKDITQLKLDIENMKKRSIKKGDFKLMEENVMKIMELVTGPDTNSISPASLDNSKCKIENQCESKNPKSRSAVSSFFVTPSKYGTNMKKKKLDTNNIKKGDKSTNRSKFNTNILGKSYNKIGQTFAVNLCLCGTQNNTEKLAQQSKIVSQNLDKMASRKQAPSEVMIPHISGIKQSKPINTNNSSKITYSRTGTVPDESSCQKNCVCFNKLPSNTSIDRLLTTLTKWKSVLTHSVENHIEETKTNEPIKIIDNIRNNDCDLKRENNELSIHQKTVENIYVTSQLNNNEVCSCIYKENQKMISKNEDQLYIAPENNNSEYMAAINLDKSNDNCCQCLKNTTKASNVAFEGKIELPLKCIDTNDCICKQPIKSVNSKLKEQQLLTKSQTQNKKQNNEPQCNKNENINNMQVDENTIVTEHVQNHIQGNNINEFEDSEACDCDYFINFLGVTVANINSQKKIKLPVIDDNLDTKQCTVIDYHNVNKNYGQILSNNENKLGKLNNAIQNEPTYIEYKSKTITCECNGNVLTKYLEEKGINAHDSSYMRNLQETIQKEKSCVCCNYNNADESKNLEENAFKLLEEYLKEKLNDFHKFSCKSSCISSEEEEKLFSAILHNVKDVISKHIKEMTCKCSESERIEGNWNRAYGLLQEYLKIKIKRVQCLCIPRESTSLPVKSVLDKVSSLIDNDFRRLKNMCKCNIEKTNKEKSLSFILYKEEIPVRDLNDCQEIESGNYSSVQQNTNSSGIVQLSTNSLSTSINTTNDFRRSHDNINNYHDNNCHDITQNVVNVKTSHSLNNVLDSDNNLINSNKISVQTSNKSIILNESTSCQVPPNLGMVTKSCECLEISTKNVQTISTISKKADNFCKLSQYDTSCDCRHSFDERDSICLGIGRRELLVNRCTELEKSEHSCSKINNVNKKVCNQRLPEEIDNTTNYEAKDVAFNNTKLKRSIDKIAPYSGSTINCSCDERNLNSCVCLKSILQENNFKITDIWKSVTEKSCLQKIPYLCTKNTPNKGVNVESEVCYKIIMNENSENTIISELIDDIETRNKVNTIQRNDQNFCDIKVSAHGEEELVLKSSKANCEQMHNTTNTLDESNRLETNYVNTENHTDWYECPQVVETETKLPIHYIHKYENGTVYSFDEHKFEYKLATDKNVVANSTISLSNQSYLDCNCDMVPICHVKLLVENIENRLGHYSCTCDSLISDVCPIHSTKFLSIS